MTGTSLGILIVVAMAFGAIVQHLFNSGQAAQESGTEPESFEHPHGIPSGREVVFILVAFACLGLLLGAVRGGV